MRTDFLIIGQGLAGSLLAWTLIQRKCRVTIVDTGVENASQVAAGIINPITGQRFVKAPEIDIVLPAAQLFYAKLGAFFNQSFYIEKPMLRVFKNAPEANASLKRHQDPSYIAYLSASIPPNQTGIIHSPYGSLHQKQTGHLLTVPLLSRLKQFFIAHDCYQQARFNFSDLMLHPTLRWQNITAKHIIFCEGYQAIDNPWFAWLPFRPAKGEILTLHSDTNLPDKLLNYGHWLLPDGTQQFRLGATFDRENIDTVPTQAGAKKLLNSLKFISTDLAAATLTRHQAHIRPCTIDRQPFIGHHPQQYNLSIFNGFGAKGSLQIPWFSQHFADALLNGAPIAPYCDIKRHF